MAYNISAQCDIGRITSRRNQKQRALVQARVYARCGYTNITILEVETGKVYDPASLAETLSNSDGGAAAVSG